MCGMLKVIGKAIYSVCPVRALTEFEQFHGLHVEGLGDREKSLQRYGGWRIGGFDVAQMGSADSHPFRQGVLSEIFQLPIIGDI
jgi:hypothetical protein